MEHGLEDRRPTISHALPPTVVPVICSGELVDRWLVARLPEAGVVEDVGRFGTKLEFDASVRQNIEALADREVDVGQIRAINQVPAEVPYWLV